MKSFPRLLTVAVLFVCVSGAAPQLCAQDRSTLSWTDLMKVRQIQNPSISDGGRWIALSAVPDRGDGAALVYSTDGSSRYEVLRGNSPVISADGAWVAMTLQASFEEREAGDGDGRPQPGLTLLSTA